MPLNATARIQGVSGSATTPIAGGSFTPTLPNPTTQGSTVMLWLATSGGITTSPPQGFDPPWFADEVHGGADFVFRRDDQPAGETSWTLSATSSGTPIPWLWWIEEWVGWATIGQPDASTGLGATIFASPHNPDTTSNATPDVNDFAALAFARASNSPGSVWPAAHSWGSGWNEIALLTSGDGSGNTDVLFSLAESYPGVSGSMSATFTWDTSGGGAIPNTTDVWLACYQPAMYQPITVSTSP